MKKYNKQWYTKLVKVATGQKIKNKKRSICHEYKNDGTIWDCGYWMLASIEGGTDWGTVGKGAVYGAGIGVAMCTVGGLLTGGSAWAMTAGCAWAGAKLGGAFTAIADNIWP